VHAHVPVIALLQLNRGPEQRADEKPAISDLRESGSLEQDADMVILLHRESAYEKDNPRQGEADFIVAKHRNGPTDTLAVAFHGILVERGAHLVDRVGRCRGVHLHGHGVGVPIALWAMPDELAHAWA